MAPETPMIKRRKPAAMRRDTLVRVLVTKAEHRRFHEAASVRGLTVSTWLRSVGLEAAGKTASG